MFLNSKEGYLAVTLTPISKLIWLCSATLSFSNNSVLIHEKPQRYLKKLYCPFLWMGFNCLKTKKPLRGDSLLNTSESPGVIGTNLIYLERMKGQYIFSCFYEPFRLYSSPKLLPNFLLKLHMSPWLERISKISGV